MKLIHRSAAVALLGSLLLAGLRGDAIGQQSQTFKQQLVGSWGLLSARNTSPSASTDAIYGARGKGTLIFESNDRFAVVLVNPDVPKFASNNRLLASPAEFEAAYKGSFASFGSYSVSESDRTFVFHMEGSTFPNFNGVDQKRIVKIISADELEFVSLTTPMGGVSEFRFRRIK